jgi:hypothetical protein
MNKYNYLILSKPAAENCFEAPKLDSGSSFNLSLNNTTLIVSLFGKWIS